MSSSLERCEEVIDVSHRDDIDWFLVLRDGDISETITQHEEETVTHFRLSLHAHELLWAVVFSGCVRLSNSPHRRFGDACGEACDGF